MKSFFPGYVAIIIFLSTACGPVENVMPKPEIAVSNDVMTNWNGCLKGSAIGIDPEAYYVSIYVKIDGLWESLSDNSNPVIPISVDNEWICTPVALEVERVSEIIIFLLPNRFNSPVLEGARNIPLKLSLVSVATHKITLDKSI